MHFTMPNTKSKPEPPPVYVPAKADSSPLVMGPEHDLSAFCNLEYDDEAWSVLCYNPDSHEIAATDARILAVVPVDGGPSQVMLMPAAAVAGLRKLSGKRNADVYATRVELGVKLTCGNLTVSAVPPVVQFPKYRSAFPTTPLESRVIVDAAFFKVIGDYADRVGRLSGSIKWP